MIFVWFSLGFRSISGQYSLGVWLIFSFVFRLVFAWFSLVVAWFSLSFRFVFALFSIGFRIVFA